MTGARCRRCSLATPSPATVMMFAGRLDDLADYAIIYVRGEEEVAAESTATPIGEDSSAGGRGPVVAAVTFGRPVASDGDDVTGRLDDLADHVVGRDRQ